jgi:hypothetical protein
VGDFAGSRLFAVEEPGGGAPAVDLLSEDGLARPENIAVKPGVR